MHRLNARLLSFLFGPLLLIAALAAPTWAQEAEFLPPEQAFPLSGEAADAETLKLHWATADGYYLYRNKLRFASEDPGVVLGEPVIPAGETKQDEFFGEVQTLHGPLDVLIPLKERGGAGPVRLKVTSQGCADAGLCYPPQHQTLEIALPAPAVATPTPPQPTPEQALASLAGLEKELGASGEPEIIPAEEAFRFKAEVAAPDRLRLHWEVAQGTYLYQDKIKLRIKAGEGVTLGAFQLPEPKVKQDGVRPDGSVGDLAVYDHTFELEVPLVRSANAAVSIQLEAAFQGCAEIGICYPPRREVVELALPAMAAVAAVAAPAQETLPRVAEPAGGAPVAVAAPAPTTPAVAARPAKPEPSVQIKAASVTTADSAPASEQDQLAALLEGGNLPLIVAAFFGIGLLLAFTPCVFPMIPILSGIIAGQGAGITTRKAFTLSLVYVLAMALTYTVVGVLAGLFGGNLQAAFQNPWILSGFILVFILLSLSMFGFYELQMPSALQTRLAEVSNRQEGGTLAGVAIMGLLSALIVGPCVAPPLVAALIYIGKTGDALLGGLSLFALSMGMGAPLLLLGTSAGKLLPRAGAWMDTIKAVFGVGLLAVAIVLLERIVPPAFAMVAWGLLMVASAVYMGAMRSTDPKSSGWSKLWQGIGLVLLIYGALMLIGAAAGGKDTVQPLRGLGLGGGAGGAQAHELQFHRIKSVADLDREVAIAAGQGRAVMLDFYADWCVSCKEMERYTFSDSEVIQALNGVVLLQADVTANDAVDQALMQGRFRIPGPPAILFFGPDGQERERVRVVGFMGAQEFAAHVKRALQ